MKKILFAVFLFLLFVFVTKSSFAQNTLDLPFLAPGTPKTIVNVTDSKKEQKITLDHFTNIIVQRDTFSEKDVKILVFEQDFDSVKLNILPKGQSPIVNYYFVYANNQGKLLTPAKPIKIESYNNFVKSLTFFYPLDKYGKIDSKNQASQPGPVLFKTDLPINNPGFIIAVNKNLDKNNPALNLGKNASPQAKQIQPTETNRTTSSVTKTILIALTIVALLIVIVAAVSLRRGKLKKTRKVEEPKKIIVGGK